jgi:peptidoglycan/LPS O-acetylase OafA/YrhL
MGAMSRMFSMRWLRWLGTISYAVFLVHVPISALVHSLIRHDFPAIGSWADAAVTAAALVLTLIVAQASYWLIERRMIALGHRAKY